jgi:hypothetical protein
LKRAFGEFSKIRRVQYNDLYGPAADPRPLDVSLGADLQPSVAEMGAVVIMVENPRTGDRNRSLDETADGRELLICPVERRFWEGARPRELAAPLAGQLDSVES